MASKNGNAAAAEARGAPDFDLLGGTINRENNSARRTRKQRRRSHTPRRSALAVPSIGGKAIGLNANSSIGIRPSASMLKDIRCPAPAGFAAPATTLLSTPSRTNRHSSPR